METILETLPNVGETVRFAALNWLFSDNYKDTVSLVLMNTYIRIIMTYPHFCGSHVCFFLAEMLGLSNFLSCFLSFWQVFMGTYPEEQFDEPAVKQMIQKFQAELSSLSEAIDARNSNLAVPYTYLNPAQIENSITI